MLLEKQPQYSAKACSDLVKDFSLSIFIVIMNQSSIICMRWELIMEWLCVCRAVCSRWFVLTENRALMCYLKNSRLTHQLHSKWCTDKCECDSLCL